MAQGLSTHLVQLALAMVPVGDVARHHYLGALLDYALHRLIASKASGEPQAGEAYDFPYDKAICRLHAHSKNMSTSTLVGHALTARSHRLLCF